jgi:hypothetical protein
LPFGFSIHPLERATNIRGTGEMQRFGQLRAGFEEIVGELDRDCTHEYLRIIYN